MSSYKINDITYPSVTTILGILDKSSALIPWAVRLAVKYCEANKDDPMVFDRALKEWRKVSEEAMDIGSEIHKLIELYIKDGRDAVGQLRPEVENGFLAFLEWEQENGCEWLQSEMTVINSSAGYAGTLDAIVKFTKGKMAGKTYVIDFKSSKGFYDGYGKQIAAYRFACGQEVDGMGVLRLDKETGEPEFKDYSEGYERKLQAFHALVDFYYADKKRRLKNNPRVF